MESFLESLLKGKLKEMESLVTGASQMLPRMKDSQNPSAVFRQFNLIRHRSEAPWETFSWYFQACFLN